MQPLTRMIGTAVSSPGTTGCRGCANWMHADIIVANEKRMMQEAVDAVIDNGRHGRPVKGRNSRAMKSRSAYAEGQAG